MATKNFNEMSNKKLNALLETANAEDRAAIQTVLKERGQVIVAEIPEEEPLTPEEEAAIAKAEAEEAAKPKKAPGRKATAPKLSDEELSTLAESCKQNVGHKCQLVPFNTAEWIDGVIVGVIAEKRSRKVLYAIQTEDSKRVVKTHDSQLLKILDEIVETKVAGRERTKRAVMTDEEAATQVAQHSENIGQTITFTRGNESITGIIAGVVCDKRTHCVMYRVRIGSVDAHGNVGTKLINLVVTAQATISETRTEEGQKVYDAHVARKNREPKAAVTLADRVAKCEANLERAKAAFEKAKAMLETREQQLAEAKAEAQEQLGSQAEAPIEETEELA